MLPAQVLLWMATIVVVCGLASGSVGRYIYDEHTGNVTRARQEVAPQEDATRRRRTEVFGLFSAPTFRGNPLTLRSHDR